MDGITSKNLIFQIRKPVKLPLLTFKRPPHQPKAPSIRWPSALSRGCDNELQRTPLAELIRARKPRPSTPSTPPPVTGLSVAHWFFFGLSLSSP